MKIEISDAVYGEIVAQDADVSAFVERAAKQALSAVKGKPKSDVSPEDRGRQLVEQFSEFRGMLKGASIDEIVKSRHVGLG